MLCAGQCSMKYYAGYMNRVAITARERKKGPAEKRELVDDYKTSGTSAEFVAYRLHPEISSDRKCARRWLSLNETWVEQHSRMFGRSDESYIEKDIRNERNPCWAIFYLAEQIDRIFFRSVGREICFRPISLSSENLSGLLNEVFVEFVSKGNLLITQLAFSLSTRCPGF